MALPPITDQPTTEIYTAAPGQRVFGFNFSGFVAAGIFVLKNGVQMSRVATAGASTEYEVSLTATGGGFITFGTPLTFGDQVTIIRSLPVDRLTRFPDAGPVPMSSINNEFDRHIAIMQDLKSSASRAFLLPLGEVGVTLVGAALRTGGDKLLGFDSVTGAPKVVSSKDIARGDPGGNVMAIGLFNNAPTLNVSVGTDLVQTKGYSSSGIGVAQYVADAAVTVAYVAANPRSSFRTANGRGFRLIAEDYVNVAWFGALGDDATDDTAAIQAAINFMKGRSGGTIFFSRGDFRISAPLECTGADRVIFQGAGGVGFGGAFPKTGARIYGTHSGDLFRFASLDYVCFERLTFDGPGCWGIRQTGTPTVDYLANLTVRECQFFGQLRECIYGNLIYAKIDASGFGYFGTTNGNHRHIFSKGTGTNTSNSNRIRGNRFYNAVGSESVVFDTGVDNRFEDNNWEQNKTLPLRLLGMPGTRVAHNWFELNSGTTAEIELANGSSLIDGTPTAIDFNIFVPHASITHFVRVNSTATMWSFCFNSGNGAGKLLTNDNSKLYMRIGNLLSGLSIPNRIQGESGSWNLTDASGSGLSIPASGTWERTGNHVDVEIGFGFPANSNNGNAKLGGLPYNAATVAVGRTISDRAGGIDVATDANAGTFTLFAPGTLTPLTNAQLSGRTIYVTIRYPVA